MAAMTAGELIGWLRRVPPETPVLVDGGYITTVKKNNRRRWDLRSIPRGSVYGPGDTIPAYVGLHTHYRPWYGPPPREVEVSGRWPKPKPEPSGFEIKVRRQRGEECLEATVTAGTWTFELLAFPEERWCLQSIQLDGTEVAALIGIQPTWIEGPFEELLEQEAERRYPHWRARRAS